MSLYAKMKKAQEDQDVAAHNACYHDDWEFLFHSSGHIMKRGDSTDAQTIERWKTHAAEEERCVYENDDILVTHAFITFPNGTKDALIMVHLKKDGLIWRTETGSTPMPNAK